MDDDLGDDDSERWNTTLQTQMDCEGHTCEVKGHTVKLSPHPHVPFTLGLLKTNSLVSLDSI